MSQGVREASRRLLRGLLLCALAAGWGCGPSGETLVLEEASPDPDPAERLCYEWREGDGWAFIAWAIDLPDGAEALALRSGYVPGETPEPGEVVRLPLPGSLAGALESRLEAARLVRQATDTLESGDSSSVLPLLREAMTLDSTWSVPAYDASLLLLAMGEEESAAAVLEPWDHKYDAALVQAMMAWESGDPQEALRQVEVSLMEPDPPFEALAAAALVYTVTGHDYQASVIWRRILAEPEADPALRLMAARYALLQEQRSGGR